MSTLHNGKSRKKLSQRIYRSTEAEDFEQLRQIIQDITKECLPTRHDILIKAVEIIRQLDRQYRSLLTEHEHVAALTSTHSLGSPTQYSAFHPAVPQFPVESWLMNHGEQATPMHPHMSSSKSSNIAYSMYHGQDMDATHNHYTLPTNHFPDSHSFEVNNFPYSNKQTW
ncbi:hypothetical protein DEU56DRAFT_205997 [Suillus clintonianus]|uniref:uncharacterized protein n=1 Tax=Suillus clintonianus TaxID=1904413 RepID=UPI001B881ECD|nr:uncharacterized protein DEU56DRAFT_205997 [Suillus clintonianus]KAG2144497.1 hypothetical protein DEU56DRAFT_205997 [Suillus clintonianus]